MKTYMTVTAISMASLIGLAIASLPFEGNRMARDRVAQTQPQVLGQEQAHTETNLTIYRGAL